MGMLKFETLMDFNESLNESRPRYYRLAERAVKA
jgi:hypothetical protein